MYSFEIYQDNVRQYRFRFKAPNGQIVAVGEGYTTKENCLHAVQLLKAQAPAAPVYDLTAARAANW